MSAPRARADAAAERVVGVARDLGAERRRRPAPGGWRSRRRSRRRRRCAGCRRHRASGAAAADAGVLVHLVGGEGGGAAVGGARGPVADAVEDEDVLVAPVEGVHVGVGRGVVGDTGDGDVGDLLGAARQPIGGVVLEHLRPIVERVELVAPVADAIVGVREAGDEIAAGRGLVAVADACGGCRRSRRPVAPSW